MRTFFALVLIIIIVVLGAPAINGLILKHNFLNAIDAINQTQEAQLQLIHYHLGWFHSSAKLKITPMDDKKNPLPAFSFMVNTNLTHGPINYDRHLKKIVMGLGVSNSRFYLPEKVKMFVKEDKHGVMQISTYAHFNGEWDNRIHIPLLQITVPGLLQITWQGLSGDYILSVKDRKIVSSKTYLKAGSVTLILSVPNSPINHIVLQGFTINDHNTRLANGLYETKSKFQIPNLSFQFQQQTVSANNFVVNHHMGLNIGKLFDVQNQILLSDFNFPGAVINKIAPVKIFSAIKNLNPDALQKE